MLPLFLIANESAQEKNVLVATKNIRLNEQLTQNNVQLQNMPIKDRSCTPLSVEAILQHQYTAANYIIKGSVICTRNANKYEKQSVVFDFGTLEIEQEGEIIFENDEFIRIKKPNGKVEKIYKDGMMQ
jgi:23S rRNA-/tRNA-specific pseudouridylate synthase